MLIIGCDFHAGFQVLAIFDNRIGTTTEKRLAHPGEAVAFYRGLQEQSQRVRVGLEAGAPCQWFRRLLAECGHELWVGDATRIRAAAVGKKKTDREDAKLILQMMREERFPRIWVPTEEERDVRQLLLDRHHRVRARTQAKNQLQALAMNQGVQKGRRLWTEAGRELLAGLSNVRAHGAAAGLLAAAGSGVGPGDRADGRAGVGGDAAAAGGAALEDASGSRAADGAGYGADAGRGEPFSFGAGGERVPGAGADGAQLGRQAAAGTHQQAGLEPDAVFAGGSRAVGGEGGRGVEARLQTVVGAQGQSRGGQGDGGTAIGSEVVLDAPPGVDVCGAGSTCGQARVILWEAVTGPCA